jgi:hypothetical protein
MAKSDSSRSRAASTKPVEECTVQELLGDSGRLPQAIEQIIAETEQAVFQARAVSWCIRHFQCQDLETLRAFREQGLDLYILADLLGELLERAAKPLEFGQLIQLARESESARSAE